MAKIYFISLLLFIDTHGYRYSNLLILSDKLSDEYNEYRVKDININMHSTVVAVY